MLMKNTRVLAFLTVIFSLTSSASGDTFGGGAFEIAFARIGNPSNLPDVTGVPNPAGAVGYDYRIGKFEISEDAINKANTLGSLGITTTNRGPNRPAFGISWLEAARFVNWLNITTGHSPAYKFNGANIELWQSGDSGFNPANLFRNSNAMYFLPSSDEWYKAAYHDPQSGTYFNFATGSDALPTRVTSGTSPGTAVHDFPYDQGPADVFTAGGLSPYGTMGQSGNVWEWEETEFDLVNDSPTAMRGKRGGSWASSPHIGELTSTFRYMGFPESELIDSLTGFRVASRIPEPTSALLLAVTVATPLLRRRRRR
jgi:sulfatase modifying factor 1